MHTSFTLVRTIKRLCSPFSTPVHPYYCSERGQRALEERLKAKAGAVLKPEMDVEASAV